MNKAIFLLFLMLFSELSAAEPISIWTRKPASYEFNRSIEKMNEVKVKTENVKPMKKFDVQYQKTIEFQGLDLEDLIADYKHNVLDNLILLHFSNGMIIPVSDRASLKSIYLARKIKEGKQLTNQFPDVSRKNGNIKDPTPIKFEDNKVVVEKPDHPLLSGAANEKKNQFSPWYHVGSLTGIEFANEEKYYRQFQPPKPSKEQVNGFFSFKHRCQYCHGVNMVGANFGWDFIDPLPVFQRRSPKHVQHLVQSSYHDAVARGLQMPTQKNVQLNEMKSLLNWIKALDQKGVSPYR